MTFNPDNPNEHEEYDAFDDAMADEPSRFFGQVTIEGYRAIHVEGTPGKWARPEPYLPELHGSEAEIAKDDGKFLSTQIEISITPTDETRKVISRTMGAKNPKRPEFKQVVRPSIEALSSQIAQVKGLQPGQFNPLRELSGLWVSGEFVPRPSNKPDETWTTLKFTRVFANQRECAEAANGVFSRNEPDEMPNEPAQKEQNDKIALAPFLASVWEEAEHDPSKMAVALANNPLLGPLFTMDSPEVQALVASAEAEKEEPSDD